MMTSEGFCERHGPYDASLTTCPHCEQEQGLPPEPPRLDDDLPTEPWGGRERSAHGVPDEDETDPRGGGGQRAGEDDEITGMPMRQRPTWDDDEEITEFPQRGGSSWEDDETIVERLETGLLGFLIVNDGMRRGQVHRIRHGTTIGRGDSSIMVRDQTVSRVHAKFTIENERFNIWDFGSEKGTLVNGDRIREATPLQENDIIRIGSTTFVLKTLR